MPVAKLDRERLREAVEVAFVGSFRVASGPLESVADDDDVWNSVKVIEVPMIPIMTCQWYVMDPIDCFGTGFVHSRDIAI